MHLANTFSKLACIFLQSQRPSLSKIVSEQQTSSLASHQPWPGKILIFHCVPILTVRVEQITDDLKVVATTKEQRQKIRAHELLERKEMLAQVSN